MKHLCDRVTFEEAVKLKQIGCTVKSDYAYKVDAIDESKHELTKLISQRDWGNWNGGSHRIFTAPTYAEVLDWMMDCGYDAFSYSLENRLNHLLPTIKK